MDSEPKPMGLKDLNGEDKLAQQTDLAAVPVDSFASQGCKRAFSPGKQEKVPSPAENEDEDDEQRSEDGEHSTLPAFMKKPEVIKMHLDILYKSIGFLSEEKIAAKIELYKQAKEQKRKEEEERLQMQIQMKKQRGRGNTLSLGQGQANRKDRKMADEEHNYGTGACTGAEDYKVDNGHCQSYQSKSLSRLQMCQMNTTNQTI